LQEGVFTGRGLHDESSAGTNGAAAQAGEAGAVRAVVGRIEAATVVADLGMQPPVFVPHEQVVLADAAVLEIEFDAPWLFPFPASAPVRWTQYARNAS